MEKHTTYFPAAFSVKYYFKAYTLWEKFAREKWIYKVTKVLCGFVCFILVFLSQTVTILYRTAGKKEGYFLNSSVITEESLPLHTASSQTRTRAFMVSELTSKPTKLCTLIYASFGAIALRYLLFHWWLIMKKCYLTLTVTLTL